MVNIEKIYFINLDKDRERKSLIEFRINEFFPGIPFERLPGQPPETINAHEAFFRNRLVEGLQAVDGRYPFPGRIGCFVAHYLALKKIENDFGGHEGENACLVLEDDCVFDKTVYPAISQCLSVHLPDDWTIVKHSRGKKGRQDLTNKQFFNISKARCRPWNWYWGAHFMIYRIGAVNEIIRKMETGSVYSFDLWIRNNVDGVYSFSRRLHIKQSNINGSNTNPTISGPGYEDRTQLFGWSNTIPYLKQKLYVAMLKIHRAFQIRSD